MKDFLIRGLTADGFIKISAVQTTQMVERMRNIHKTLPLATAALGRTLTAASMMGDELKDKNGSVTIQIKGGGPLGTITAVSDCNGNTRGYLQNPAVELPLKQNGKLDVCGGVGQEGILSVLKDVGAGAPFSGKVELQSGEIAEDIAGYYAISEQIPTVCALGVLVGQDQAVLHAGGYILQLMPGAPEQIISEIEQRVATSQSVTAQMSRGLDIGDIISRLLEGLGYQKSSSHHVCYECKCSRKKVQGALISLGRPEIEDLSKKQENIHVTCQFCDAEYEFSGSEILSMLK